MSVVLVTGCSGFVGRHLGPQLKQAGSHTVIGLDMRDPNSSAYDDWVREDLLDIHAMRRILDQARPQVVFHLAGLASGTDEELHRSNVETTRVLLDTCADSDPSIRIVVVGSAAEYGLVPGDQQPVRESCPLRPVSSYGRAKAAVTALAMQHAARGLNVVEVRPFNIVGPGTPVTLIVGALIARLRKALRSAQGYAIDVGRIDSVRDFVAVQDVTVGMVAAAAVGVAGAVYNLCSGVGTPIKAIVEQLIELTGKPISVKVDPRLVRANEADAMVGDHQLATSELGWTPRIPLAESLAAAWQASAPAPNVAA